MNSFQKQKATYKSKRITTKQQLQQKLLFFPYTSDSTDTAPGKLETISSSPIIQWYL